MPARVRAALQLGLAEAAQARPASGLIPVAKLDSKPVGEFLQCFFSLPKWSNTFQSKCSSKTFNPFLLPAENKVPEKQKGW